MKFCYTFHTYLFRRTCYDVYYICINCYDNKYLERVPSAETFSLSEEKKRLLAIFEHEIFSVNLLTISRAITYQNRINLPG